MPWKKYERVAPGFGTNRPNISVARDRFNFNAALIRAAGLREGGGVIVHVDPATYRVAFEFTASTSTGALALRPINRRRPASGMYCASRGVGTQYPWIARIGFLPDRDARRFPAQCVQGYWVIHLSHDFSGTAPRSGAGIPDGAEGLFRFVDARGDVVYIGSGRIGESVASPEAAGWAFDHVQYSIITDEIERAKRKAFWLAQFKAANSGKLPRYNQLRPLRSARSQTAAG